VAGRGLQPRPERLTDEDMAVVIENARDGGATPVPLVENQYSRWSCMDGPIDHST